MTNLLAGAALAVGLALTAPGPGALFRPLLAAGIVVWAWRGLWELTIALLSNLAPPGRPFDEFEGFALNAALAGLSAAMVAGALRLTRRWLPRGGPAPASAGWFGVAWAAPLMLPDLGRAGAWPIWSLFLAGVVMALSFALGRATSAAVHRSGIRSAEDT